LPNEGQRAGADIEGRAGIGDFKERSTNRDAVASGDLLKGQERLAALEAQLQTE
jgi:hypothetical protein